MADASHFRAPRLSDDEIRKAADAFRENYASQGELPIDILDIVEFDLDLTLQPISGLRSVGDVEALLLSDFATIVVDKGDFLDARAQNRLRYSVAHEIGHYQLHREIIQRIRPASFEEWVELITEISDSEYSRIEYQAYEFAGRLLVPIEPLKQSLDELSKEITKAYDMSPGVDDNLIIEYVAAKIAKRFGVSSGVIIRRIRNERLWTFGSE